MAENYFVGAFAEHYDDPEQIEFDPAVIERTVTFLAELAGNGPALELAIGTGRIAVPLASRGVAVCGIELSEDMVAQLRRKAGGEAIAVTIGDMTTATAPGPSEGGAEVGTFSSAYLVYNTIGNVVTQDAQVECFVNAARHLAVGGTFCIEVIVPQLRRLPPGDRLQAFMVTPTHVGVDEIDVVTQTGISHHYWVGADGRGAVFHMPWRYVWPSELDLMARLAGLRLRNRFGDWDRSAFGAESFKHVSVWEKV